jgi:hypothetical protein
MHPRRSPMRARWTPIEIALVTSVVAVGAALRWWHIDGPSLWWDEVIHVGTAQQPTVSAVLRLVKRGSPPGSGNAGAVPLDYVLLHAWLAVVPFPDPRHLEAYLRFPAFVWSALTPLVLHLWARRRFDPATGLAAATCLALTTIHVAYAVEARFYALFCLLTVVNLATFSWVVASRRPLAWCAFTVMGAVYFLSGLFALLVLAVEYVSLGVDVLWRWWRHRRRPELQRPGELAFLFGTASAVGIIPIVYYHGTRLAVTARTKRPPIRVLQASLEALWTYTSMSWVIVALFALGIVLVVARAVRRRTPGAQAATLVLLALATLPTIATVERWKLYYFHPRHGLFLTPVVALLVGIGAAALARGVAGRRRWLGLVLAPVLVAAALAPRALEYVRRPQSVLWLTKSLRDFTPVMEELTARLESAPPSGKILLVAPLYGRGPLTNPVVARYLAWWGLRDRVVFRGTAILGTTLTQVRDVCGRSCRGRPGAAVERAIGGLEPPIVLAPDARRMLGLWGRPGRWPGTVAGLVLLDYDNLWRVAVPLGYVGSVGPGLRTWHLPGDPPPQSSTPPAA